MNKKTVKKKVIKRKVIKKKDTGMGELLGLLKTRPHLVHALLVDHRSVMRLLQSKAARRLVPGLNAKSLLKRVRAAGLQGRIYANCYGGTRWV